jgi:N-acyl-D-amino-acid deacylase
MSYDIIIKNGKIIDGTGNPGYSGEIAIKKGKIVKIRHRINDETQKLIDATGLIVCPGFIDMHSHTDWVLPVNRSQESTLCQGITTSVVAMCGEGNAPIPYGKEVEFKKMMGERNRIFEQLEYPYHTFAEYLNYVEKLKNTANLIFMVGYKNLRFVGGHGRENRPANEEELETMKKYLREAMEAGAFGMSTGLIYAPQVFGTTEELIELAKIVAEYGGLYFSHIRGEGETVIKAVEELIEIVEKSRCAGGQIAHHKICGETYWGRSKETVQLMEEANERGINISCDQYPYNRKMSNLITAFPPWVREGENQEILERIKKPEIQEKIKKEVESNTQNWENWIRDEGFKNMYIVSINSIEWKDIIGKSIPEITKIKGFSNDWETCFKLLIENDLNFYSIMITIESMGEDDIRRIMTSPYSMIGTDGFGLPASFRFGALHPRCFGTYPRILEKYVREEKLLTLEEAIRKMTSFPAQRLGLRDRNVVLEGNWADIVLFNLDTVKDVGTYENPYQLPEGILHVIVNGVMVVENAKLKKKYPGMVIRRPT